MEEKKIFDAWGYKWRVGQPWGLTHPKKLNTWYDANSVYFFKHSNTLHLSVRYHPKEFLNEQGKTIVKNLGIGLVSCCTSFGYGRFEWIVRLPEGLNLWPAVWLCGDTWPPEIDCVEGYTTNKSTDYKRCRCAVKQNLKPNVHYKDDTHDHLQVGAIMTNCKFVKNPFKENIFTVNWQRQVIEIFYNYNLVYKVKDRKILKSFDNHLLYPIMNFEVSDKFKDNQVNLIKSSMYIIDFKYYKSNLTN